MRREITAAVVGVLVFGGITATPAFAAEHAKPVAHAKAKPLQAQALKTIIYDDYQFQVPRSWPVYRLDQNPSECERYDIDAVYLGAAGPDSTCPPGLVGRAATVGVVPNAAVRAGSGAGTAYQQEQLDGLGATAVRSLTAVHAAVIKNVAQEELQVKLGTAALGATVSATYGPSGAAAAEQVLATLRAAPAGAVDSGQSGSPQALMVSSAARASALSQSAEGAASATTAAAAPSLSPRWKGLPPHGFPIQVVKNPPPSTTKRPTPKRPKPKPPKPRTATVHPVSGFDACQAPSLATMRAWRRAYAGVGYYLGGMNTGCSGGNVSPSWVRSIARLGFGMMPIYLGLQADCVGQRNLWTMVPGQAAAEGAEEGRWAAADAGKLGISRGSPLYFDMEAYGRGRGCIATVLTFIGAWDRAVTRAGYRTGVYSSQDSGIVDMEAGAVAKTPGFTRPDAIWIALWGRDHSLNDGKLDWRLADRLKQYSGNVWVTVGGITMEIDKDVVASGTLAH